MKVVMRSQEQLLYVCFCVLLNLAHDEHIRRKMIKRGIVKYLGEPHSQRRRACASRLVASALVLRVTCSDFMCHPRFTCVSPACQQFHCLTVRTQSYCCSSPTSFGALTRSSCRVCGVCLGPRQWS